VRRGDYLRLPNQFPICGVDYYQRALQVLPRVRDARFVICSDDPEWCIDELAFLGDVTVSNRALSPPEDLALMAGCDHNIIANSAFGWWSAWLNPNPNKVVVAPKRWFGPLGPADAFDLVPETWLKI
jgi:hypothetical protein